MGDSAAAAPESAAAEGAAAMDSVTAMQESVDKLALSMFDAIRLIPGGENNPQPPPGGGVPPPAVQMDGKWEERVKELGEGVLIESRRLEELMDKLPGADLTEKQQLEELERLDAESRKQRDLLAEAVEKAERLQAQQDHTLDRLAQHMLEAPASTTA